jgi:hypothetical protein
MRSWPGAGLQPGRSRDLSSLQGVELLGDQRNCSVAVHIPVQDERRPGPRGGDLRLRAKSVRTATRVSLYEVDEFRAAPAIYQWLRRLRITAFPDPCNLIRGKMRDYGLDLAPSMIATKINRTGATPMPR